MYSLNFVFVLNSPVSKTSTPNWWGEAFSVSLTQGRGAFKITDAAEPGASRQLISLLKSNPAIKHCLRKITELLSGSANDEGQEGITGGQ